jgi:hypothetical protein
MLSGQTIDDNVVRIFLIMTNVHTNKNNDLGVEIGTHLLNVEHQIRMEEEISAVKLMVFVHDETSDMAKLPHSNQVSRSETEKRHLLLMAELHLRAITSIEEVQNLLITFLKWWEVKSYNDSLVWTVQNMHMDALSAVRLLSPVRQDKQRREVACGEFKVDLVVQTRVVMSHTIQQQESYKEMNNNIVAILTDFNGGGRGNPFRELISQVLVKAGKNVDEIETILSKKSDIPDKRSCDLREVNKMRDGVMQNMKEFVKSTQETLSDKSPIKHKLLEPLSLDNLVPFAYSLYRVGRHNGATAGPPSSNTKFCAEVCGVILKLMQPESHIPDIVTSFRAIPQLQVIKWRTTTEWSEKDPLQRDSTADTTTVPVWLTPLPRTLASDEVLPVNPP